MKVKEIVAPIVTWHREHKRDLPWRVDPSPYHTWLSEIMLPQTRVEAVIPYFHKFLSLFPIKRLDQEAYRTRLLVLTYCNTTRRKKQDFYQKIPAFSAFAKAKEK